MVSVRHWLETVLPPLTFLAGHVGGRVTCQPAAPSGGWLYPSGQIASPQCLGFLICEAGLPCPFYLLLQGCCKNPSGKCFYKSHARETELYLEGNGKQSLEVAELEKNMIGRVFQRNFFTA